MQGATQNRQARIAVAFRLPNDPDFTLEFVVDTGFEGALTLPLAAIIALVLPLYADIKASLADGTSVSVDVYIGTIVWDGVELEVAALAMGTRPLLGTALLENRILEADFREGGLVRIMTP